MDFVQFQICDFATGAGIPFGKCFVYASGTSTLAALFNASGGSIANPVVAGSDAQVGFSAADGTYDFQPAYPDGSPAGPKILKQQLRDLSAIGSGGGPVDLAKLGVSSSNSASANAAIVNAAIGAGAGGRGDWFLLPAGDIPMGPIADTDRPIILQGRGQGGKDGKVPTNLIFNYGIGKGIEFKAGGLSDVGAQRSSLRDLRIDFQGTPLSNGVASYSTAAPNTINISSGAAFFANGAFVALEGAGTSYTVPGKTAQINSGSNTATITSADGANPLVYVGQWIDIAGAGLPAGTTVTSWSGTTITLSNNATATVSGAAYTIRYPLFGQITAGGGTSSITITTPYQAQNCTGGVLRHMDCAVFASCTVDLHNVEINAQGSSGILSAGGNCGLFFYGIAGEGTNADSSQCFNVKTGGNLSFAGVICYGSDANVIGFHGCNFAGPKVSFLDNSILGQAISGGSHFAFNVGIVSILASSYCSLSQAYFEGGTSYGGNGAQNWAYGCTGINNGYGWNCVGPSQNDGIFGNFPSIVAPTLQLLGNIGGATGGLRVFGPAFIKSASYTFSIASTMSAYPTGAAGIQLNQGQDGSRFYQEFYDHTANAYAAARVTCLSYEISPGNVIAVSVDSTGLDIKAGKVLKIAGTKVMGGQQGGCPVAATDLASAITLVNFLRSAFLTHGAIAP
jgi:hypothetical protein